jgi:hypothetical protein
VTAVAEKPCAASASIWVLDETYSAVCFRGLITCSKTYSKHEACAELKAGPLAAPVHLFQWIQHRASKACLTAPNCTVLRIKRFMECMCGKATQGPPISSKPRLEMETRESKGPQPKSCAVHCSGSDAVSFAAWV